MTTQEYQLGFVHARMRFHGLSKDGESNVGMIEVPQDSGIAIVRAKDRGTDVKRTYLMLHRGMLQKLLLDESLVVMDVTVAHFGCQDKWSWTLESMLQVWFCKPPAAEATDVWRVVPESADYFVNDEDQQILDEALEKRVQWIRPSRPDV